MIAEAPFIYPGVVEFERLATWPKDLVALLEAKLSELRAYENRCREISRRHRVSIAARLRPHINLHSAKYKECVLQAEGLLAGERLLCFHCTRLTPEEIDNVKARGLEPLNQALVERRLCLAVDLGYLSPDLADRLRRDNQVADRGRVGRVAFVNQRSVLQDRWAVIRLFSSWGGEALYNQHEHRHDTGAVLRSIGTPAIVVLSIPISVLQTDSLQSIAERFLRCFLADRGVLSEHGVDLQTVTTGPVGPEHVLEIVTVSDPRFEMATGWSTWTPPKTTPSQDKTDDEDGLTTGWSLGADWKQFEGSAPHEVPTWVLVGRLLWEAENDPAATARVELQEARRHYEKGEIVKAYKVLERALPEKEVVVRSREPTAHWADARLDSLRDSRKNDCIGGFDLDDNAALEIVRQIEAYRPGLFRGWEIREMAKQAASHLRRLVVERQRLERQRNLNRVRYHEALREIQRLDPGSDWRPDTDRQ